MLLNEVIELLDKSSECTVRVEGIYRVSRIHWHQDPLIGPCRQLDLYDSTGSIKALLPGGECKPWLVADAPYSLQIVSLAHLPNPTVRIIEISEAPEAGFNPITIIPSAWTTKPEYIPRLFALYTGLNSEAIALFWQDVFRNQLWLKGFLSIPASLDCHHSNPGELFAHSVSVAESVAATMDKQLSLNPVERDAAITVALLHDATKAVWIQENRNRWRIPFLPREHERLLPYFLAGPLIRLERRNRDDWATLVRIIDDYIRPKERSNSPLSQLIRTADQLDSHLDARLLSQKSMRHFRNWNKIGGRMHWSPVLPTEFSTGNLKNTDRSPWKT